MKPLVEGLRTAVASKSYQAALALALTLPDICGSVMFPGTSSSKRYPAWWAKYMEPVYTLPSNERRPQHLFLSGGDAYALRCSFLHLGSGDVTRQRARKALDEFEFVEFDNGTIHLNQRNQKLQLQVDTFCLEIADGVERYLKDVEADAEAQASFSEMLSIQKIDLAKGFSF